MESFQIRLTDIGNMSKIDNLFKFYKINITKNNQNDDPFLNSNMLTGLKYKITRPYIPPPFPHLTALQEFDLFFHNITTPLNQSNKYSMINSLYLYVPYSEILIFVRCSTRIFSLRFP